MLGAGERIGVARTLRATTIGAAHVLRRDDRLGSQEHGKFADFAILEQDLFTVHPSALKDVWIWGAALSGKLQPA